MRNHYYHNVKGQSPIVNKSLGQKSSNRGGPSKLKAVEVFERTVTRWLLSDRIQAFKGDKTSKERNGVSSLKRKCMLRGKRERVR